MEVSKISSVRNQSFTSEYRKDVNSNASKPTNWYDESKTEMLKTAIEGMGAINRIASESLNKMYELDLPPECRKCNITPEEVTIEDMELMQDELTKMFPQAAKEIENCLYIDTTANLINNLSRRDFEILKVVNEYIHNSNDINEAYEIAAKKLGYKRGYYSIAGTDGTLLKWHHKSISDKIAVKAVEEMPGLMRIIRNDTL